MYVCICLYLYIQTVCVCNDMCMYLCVCLRDTLIPCACASMPGQLLRALENMEEALAEAGKRHLKRLVSSPLSLHFGVDFMLEGSESRCDACAESSKPLCLPFEGRMGLRALEISIFGAVL